MEKEKTASQKIAVILKQSEGIDLIMSEIKLQTVINLTKR